MARTGLALVVLAMLQAAAPAQASVARALSIEELTAQADLVVRGHVTRQQAAWTRGGRIVTTARLAVDEVLKGTTETALDVRHVGGHVGQIGQQVAGEVSFTEGEEVVLFLRAHPTVAGSYVVVGMSQGKFHVERAGTTTVPDVRQELEGLGLLTETGAVEDRPGEKLALPELLSRVSRAAAR